MTLFFRVLEDGADHKALVLQALVRDVHASTRSQWVFDVDPTSFAEVTASPFSYWVPESVRAAFRHPPLEHEGRTAKQGLSTTDDYRFVRLCWEVYSTVVREKWFPFAKGGVFSLGYASVHLVVDWLDGGHEMYAFTGIVEGMTGAPMRNPQFYFRPGLTWPLRTQSGLGLRAMPAGCVFGHKGPSCYVPGDDFRELLALLGIAISSPFRYLVELQTAFGSYEVGVIQRTPVPSLREDAREHFAQLARRFWSYKRTLDTIIETSHAFLLPATLRTRAGSFDPDALSAEISVLQRHIDDLAFSLYGISGHDRAQIEAWATRSPSATAADASESGATTEADADEDEPADTDTALDLMSWTVGVAFGRFDHALALTTSARRDAPPEPQPFDPLPARSPGMLPEGAAPFRPNRGIYVDDEGASDDLAGTCALVYHAVDLASAPDLRRTLAKDFFAFHVKRYSKSRRKAPIYWQLATPTASYSVWLYIHAFNKDTLFTVQNDFVAEKLRFEEGRLDGLRRDHGPNPTASQRKELTTQEQFVQELRAFLDDVKRVAPLWDPDLDDGVIINAAPLWRLFPQNRAWQKECRATWDALCKGAYDWSHLAMRLWPERVIPKCAKDRSLAIAHGLEDVFWVTTTEGKDAGKWKPRPGPARPIEDILRDRTSPAIKAALAAFVDTPLPGGSRESKGKAPGKTKAKRGGKGQEADA